MGNVTTPKRKIYCLGIESWFWSFHDRYEGNNQFAYYMALRPPYKNVRISYSIQTHYETTKQNQLSILIIIFHI